MAWAFLAAVAFSGCVAPVGVRRMDAEEANRKLTESVLAGANLSAPTMQIINRSGHVEKIEAGLAGVIAAIHQGLPTAREPDRRFALAELSFLHAARSGDRAHYLAAAVYAYAFIFPREAGDAPGPFDPRLRTAVDLYNQGLAQGFTDKGERQAAFKAGSHRLPFGELIVDVDPQEFRWGPFRMENFVAASELEVRGLRNDYRWPGIGTALEVSLKHVKGEYAREFARVPSSLKVPATAFLHLETVEAGLRSGRIHGRLVLYTTQEGTSVTVAGRTAPLEFWPTAALASILEGSQVYDMELKGLLFGDLELFKQSARFKDNVFLMAPYRPGRIPVVFVHGTASSPARWAQILNEIINDPELRHRYQIWLFTYNTGNPIVYSAGILAHGLRNVVQELDPEGQDPALQKMVVIGHSQGGMLAKLTAADSGSRFWEQSFTIPIDLDRADLLAVYWTGDAIAHVMLSFGFQDKDFVAFSIETRTEQGEGYSTLKGFFKQYELTYIVADERDLIRVRTDYRDPAEDVSLYRLKMPRENMRKLFLEYIRQINAMKETPEWYNTLTTNCTTNVVRHVRAFGGRAKYTWKALLSGYAPQYAYELGALDATMPFEELRRRSYINPRAQAVGDDPGFSTKIREGLPRPEWTAAGL